MRSKSRLLYWLVAFALAVFFLWLSLHKVSWPEIGRTLLHADLRLIALGVAISSFTLFVRALRWRVLLLSEAEVPVATAYWATCAGYFGNNFLPARAGELVRTLLISARTGLSKTFVLTTALSERLSDAITLVVVSSIVLLTLPVRPGWFNAAAKPFAIVGLCGAACIAVLPRTERLWELLLGRLPLPHAFRDKLIGILRQILVGLRAFHSTGRLTRFAALTAVIWFSDGLGTIVGMRALGLTISLPVAFLLITGFGLGSALPATPGYVGIYQFVAVSVLAPFGFAKADAIAYSFLAQAVQYVLTGFWGLIALSRQRGFSLKSIKEQSAV